MKTFYYRSSFLLLLGLGTVLLSSCEADDVDEIREELQNHDERIKTLEEWQKSVNSDLHTIKDMLQRVQDNDVVTNISPLSDGSGYVLTFMKGKSVTIHHGIDGMDGMGGHDGVTPKVGVKLEEDGRYYWTINGEFLLNDNDAKVPATGEKGEQGEQGDAGQDGVNGQDGQDGADGTDGADGVTPQLRINSLTNEWQVSLDNGISWRSLGIKATGPDGEKGEQGGVGPQGDVGIVGPQGEQGQTGTASSPIQSFEVTENCVILVINGETIVIPRIG